MSGSIRTVLGDIGRAEFGWVNYHEHLFQVSPLLPGDELDDEAASLAEAKMLTQSGFSAMVDATPTGLGRRPDALARISRESGMRIVATTGAHREAHYGGGHWITELSQDQLATRFIEDVSVGTASADEFRRAANTEVHAGLLKAGIDYWSISTFERRVLDAISAAHLVTNAPVMIHLEHGSATFEVLQILAQNGVPADAVALAHIDRNPDPGLHAELSATGAFLGYDGVARSKSWPDSVVLDCLMATAERGGAEKILLGGDVARRTRYKAYGGLPGLEYLGRRFVPRLLAAGSADLVEQILIKNPVNWLGRFG